MGRTVLINAVLDGLLSYVMGALYLPPGAVNKVDKRRRGFLWTGEGEANGANCLVTWDKVRCSKDQGGLGIKDLEVQNICLLLKLLHRLYTGTQSSWANWVRQHVCLASLEGLDGNHWDTLRSLLPLYQAITSVDIGHGRYTSFWHDVWDGDESMAERFPALYSHCKKPQQSVSAVVEAGLRRHLVPRLTTIADEELLQVQEIVSRVSLTDEDDRRSSPFASIEGNLVTSALYKLLKSNRNPNQLQLSGISGSGALVLPHEYSSLLGCSCMIGYNVNKKIVDSSICDLCNESPETAEHLLLHCPFFALAPFSFQKIC